MRIHNNNSDPNKKEENDERQKHPSEEEEKKVELPDKSGEEFIQKQGIIPSPCWEPFIAKDT